MVKVYDGFYFPTIGSITLHVEVGSKCLDVTFSIIPTLNQFCVKLRHPWNSSVNVIPSIIYKCLKFPNNDTIIAINNSIYQPIAKCGHFNLDYFWPKQTEPLKPQSDILFLSYQKWKNEMIMSVSKLIDPIPMDIPPHNGPGILPTPSIPLVHASTPTSTSYKGNILASSMSQPSGVSFVPPPLREEKKPMSVDPQPAQPSIKTKKNHFVREHR